MPSVNQLFSQKKILHRFLPFKSTNLRRLSGTEINELQIAEQKIVAVLSRKKYKHYQAIKIDLTSKLESLLGDKEFKRAKIVPLEEIQSLRNDVISMVENKSPSNGINRYVNRNKDGNPIDFFKRQYGKYIHSGKEVIFTTDLLKIDPVLLTALRNVAFASEMPLGDRTKKTEALAKGLFVDGEKSALSAAVAIAARKARQRKPHTEIA